MATIKLTRHLITDEISREVFRPGASRRDQPQISCRLVTAATVDLRKSNGYSLGEGWQRWGEAVVCHPGQYLVAQATAMPNARAIVAWTTEDDEMIIDVTAQLLDQSLLAQGQVPDEYRAKAINSAPYAIALAIHHFGVRKLDPTTGQADPVPALIDQLLALRPEQQARLLKEWQRLQTPHEKAALAKALCPGEWDRPANQV